MSPMPALQPPPCDPEHEALEWFARLRQPGCDDSVRQAFGVWCQDPLNAHAYAQLEAYWQRLQVPSARPRPRVHALRRSRAGVWLGLTFLTLLAILVWLYWPMLQRWGSELHTASGERRSVRLADGSTLHLDSASAMNVDLRARTRQLQLVQGQVYLEVMLDGRAMEVQVDDTRIQVFGTRLQIARYADHDELLVFNGKATVSQGDDQRMISAGERVTFTEGRINLVEKTDIKSADAWRDGRLKADNRSLGHVLERLAGYQGQRVWVMDEQVAHRRVSGDFDLDHPAQSLERLAADQQLRLHAVLGHWLIVR
ncbi:MULTISPECIES: FecR domain-containing protein [unclassified Pseudomonas]|uniref:FecR family protein n=1 Tax=unclassified Pseudomonas TaxID=196821 RepID=UPI00244A52BB|nr:MULTISPECIES: FecR domain-containing protein [unclassified Pseudomonas]MDH0303148.1 FecR domain-containing protein [Pseudomonas sp. GD04091]MDH1985909.1 FecR domain-containing protein [Pseudomonas sp. GD03689]